MKGDARASVCETPLALAWCFAVCGAFLPDDVNRAKGVRNKRGTPIFVAHLRARGVRLADDDNFGCHRPAVGSVVEVAS